MEYERRIEDLRKLGEHAGAEGNHKEDEQAYREGVKEGYEIGINQGRIEGRQKALEDLQARNSMNS